MVLEARHSVPVHPQQARCCAGLRVLGRGQRAEASPQDHPIAEWGQVPSLEWSGMLASGAGAKF